MGSVMTKFFIAMLLSFSIAYILQLLYIHSMRKKIDNTIKHLKDLGMSEEDIELGIQKKLKEKRRKNNYER